MKCTLFNAVAIAASLGLATTASAQYQTSARYSSYGHVQEAAQQQETSPSDVVVPPAVIHPAPSHSGSDSPVTSTYSGGSAGCDTGAGNGYFGGGSAANCDGGVGSSLIHNNDRNVVFGMRGLVFDRNYEDRRLYGTNGFAESLYSNDSDLGEMYGFEATLGVRNCNGRGWEVGYWGLYPSRSDVTLAGPPFTTALTGLADVSHGGFAVDQIFNTADTWRTYRENDIHNLEFNLLRNGGATQGFCGGNTNIEWLAGFRWFQFDENIRLASFNSNAPYPTRTYYDVEAENALLGFQLGARADRCLTEKLSVTLGCKFGLYTNRMNTSQSIHDGNGTYGVVTAGPYTGSDYNLSSRDDEAATLGELDLGLNYQISQCWRANVGYRAFGVSGIALAPEQIPYNFQTFNETNTIKSNGDLLLHGAYFGLERAY